MGHVGVGWGGLCRGRVDIRGELGYVEEGVSGSCRLG